MATEHKNWEDAVTTLGDELSQKATEWMNLDFNAKTREEMQNLILEAAAETKQLGDTSGDKYKSLHERLLKRIVFGTAGLRARMTSGFHYINHLIVVQTTQGFCRYLEQKCGAALKERGVVIGFDGRYNSMDYAHLAAGVFLSQGVRVHLFPELCCTPMVPFGVLELNAAAGVMVTASHNPKDDNGYKVYWGNGCQIIPPHDTGIADLTVKPENMKPWQVYPDRIDMSNKLVSNPTAALTKKYMDESVKRYSFYTKENAESKVPITYTAMHGVGAPWVTKCFEAFQLPPYVPTKEQVEPDPEFPTVKFPNPEEGKGALALAIKTAEANGSSVILANDPDADRLAVAEHNPKTKEWNILNGNMIAALLADWVFKNEIKNNPQTDKSKLVMVASTVSSKFLKAMADKEGFTFVETLTGFKWIGNACSDYASKGYKVLLGYEVEIGFLIGDLSLDKDGVRSAAVFAEMTNQLYKSGTTLVEHLESLYQKYGYYEMNTSYFFSYTDEPLEAVFKHLRNGGPDGGYVNTCGPNKISGLRDVTTGYDNTKPNNKSTLPTMPDSHMITFTFENGCVATMRNSGTEPKLKYYVEAAAKTREAARKLTDDMTASLIKEFMQPEKNGLIARKTP